MIKTKPKKVKICFFVVFLFDKSYLVFHHYKNGSNFVSEHIGIGRCRQPFSCQRHDVKSLRKLVQEPRMTFKKVSIFPIILQFLDLTNKIKYLFWPDIWGRLCNLQEFGPSFVVDLVLIDLWHQAIDLDDGNPRFYWTYHWIFWWNPSKYQRPLEESSQWRFQLCFHFALATILKKDDFWRKRNFRQSRKIHAFQAWN